MVLAGMPASNEFAFLYDNGEWRLHPDEASLAAPVPATAPDTEIVPCFRPIVVDVHPSVDGISGADRTWLGARGVRIIQGGPDTDETASRDLGRGYSGAFFPSSPRLFWREHVAKQPPTVEGYTVQGSKYAFREQKWTTLTPQAAGAHILRNRSSWREGITVDELLLACMEDDKCRSFDTNGNLFDCAGGCDWSGSSTGTAANEASCCRMRTTLRVDRWRDRASGCGSLGVKIAPATGLPNVLLNDDALRERWEAEEETKRVKERQLVCVEEETSLWTKHPQALATTGVPFRAYQHAGKAVFEVLAKQALHFRQSRVKSDDLFARLKGHVKGKILINSEDPTACVNAIVIAGSTRRRAARTGVWGQQASPLSKTVGDIMQLGEGVNGRS